MPEPKKLTLATAAGGAAPELFEHELEKVLANIRDVNTPARKPRRITLTFTFEAKEDRQGTRREMDVSVDVQSKLVPVRRATSWANIETHQGKLIATTNDVLQGDLLEQQPDPAVAGTIQPSTPAVGSGGAH